MRSKSVFALSLLLTACGSAPPKQATSGPRLAASLAASWPTAKAARHAVFSRDGGLAAFSDASGTITIRDPHSWAIIQQLRHPGGATALAFSKDGSRLFSAGYDGAIREWDLASRSQVQAFKTPSSTIWTIAMSPDGKRLAAAGEDAIIRVWNLGSPGAPTELGGHTRNIWEVRFSPDGKRLASCSFDYSVRLWDAEAGRPLKTLAGHKQPRWSTPRVWRRRRDDPLLARFGRRGLANRRQHASRRQGRVQQEREMACQRRPSARVDRRALASTDGWRRRRRRGPPMAGLGRRSRCWPAPPGRCLLCRVQP